MRKAFCFISFLLKKGPWWYLQINLPLLYLCILVSYLYPFILMHPCILVYSLLQCVSTVSDSMDIPLPGEIPLPGLSNPAEIPIPGFFDRLPPPPPHQPPAPPGPPPILNNSANFSNSINRAFNPSGPPASFSSPGLKPSAPPMMASKASFPPPSDDVDVLFQPPTHKEAGDDPDFYSPFSPSRVSDLF